MIIDFSVLVIYALLVASLALGYLPSAHPEWSPTILWSTALLGGVLFFASVLAHEMGHALIGRALGMSVKRVRLFILGGLADVEGEPKKPAHELAMTLAGPLTSILLGVAFTSVGLAIAGSDIRMLAREDPIAALSALDPIATTFLWLGPANLVLGAFNLIPGFPLDGGRALRAIAWAVTGSFERATRFATSVGRAFGFALIGAGLLLSLGWYVPSHGGALIGGVYLALVGWFLSVAARRSRRRAIANATPAGH